GMAAMANGMNHRLLIQFIPSIYAASVAIAMVASAGALLFMRAAVQANYGQGRIFHWAAAATMGLAISAMHYTGMAGTVFIPIEEPSDPMMHFTYHDYMVVLVAVVAFTILGLVLTTSNLSRRMVASLE